MSDIFSLGSMLGAVQGASTTIHRASAAVKRDAEVVAASSAADSASSANSSAPADSGSSVSSRDVVAALVDSRQQLLYTQAGAKMMRTADEMLGTLIDIRA